MNTFFVTKLFLLPIVCNSLPITISDHDVSEGLVLLHVVHRHGHRTPEFSTYPNDPHKNFTFFPPGLGQLTNTGKKRMYQVGKDLRGRYNKFLGDEYYPDILYARTTDIDRTKMSLQLTLAGLFPPTEESKLDPELGWQPIPYNYDTWEKDNIIGIASVVCPKYSTLLREYAENLTLSKEDLIVYNYIAIQSGFNLVDTILKMTIIHSSLKTQEEWGFEPPPWVSCLWEKPLENLAIENFARLTATKELAKLSGGFFVKKVLEDTISKINGSLVPQERKLFLYSSHDFTLANILGALGVFPNKLFNYGCYIIIEVRNVDGVYGIEVLFQNNEGNPVPEVLTIPGCTPFCPLDNFITLTEEIIPEDQSVCDADT